MNFYDLLRHYIIKNEIKHVVLASRLGVSPNYITNILSKRTSSPTFEMTEKLANVFNLIPGSYERIEFFKSCWLAKFSEGDKKFFELIGFFTREYKTSIIDSIADEELRIVLTDFYKLPIEKRDSFIKSIRALLDGMK